LRLKFLAKAIIRKSSECLSNIRGRPYGGSPVAAFVHATDSETTLKMERIVNRGTYVFLRIDMDA
jgi:hypothetical protein